MGESPADNIASWIAGHAQRRGDALALVDAERRLDYAALDARVRRCAAVLADRGVGPGDRVALLLGNRSAYLETLFAAAHRGAIAVPLNARLTAHEIHGLLDDCRPRLLLCDAGRAETAERACRDLPEPPRSRLLCSGPRADYEAALDAARPCDEPAAVSPEAPALIMYTSGTTGRPKGALLPHRKALYNARNAEIFFELTASDRVLVVLPLFHSFGLQILALPALYAGARVVLQERFDPARVWRGVGDEGITFFGAVPTMFAALYDQLESGGPEPDLSSLRFLFTAGAAISVDLIRAYEARGLVLKQGFGQTETSIVCCLDSADAVRKAGSVGRPVHHADVRVVRTSDLPGPSESWRDVRPGEVGEIVVRGPVIMTGYWGRPEDTAEVLRGEWLRTGDLATVDEEGFLTLTGRARDMYISGGENVYPAEVEATYEAHPAIREIAVVGVPDPRWGETGHAYCVLAPGAELDAEALRRWGGERLAGFKLPTRFVAVGSLPRTETGKVMKHALAG